VKGDARLRQFDRRDADAVWTLHERALRDAGTDPNDVPGTDDLQRIEAAYLGSGGDFLVGTVPNAASTGNGGGGAPTTSRNGTNDGNDASSGNDRDDTNGSGSDPERRRPPRTFDGALIAMGGFLPVRTNGIRERASHADEPPVPGAAELHRMRVAPTHQRRGHGRALLAALERRATDLGFDVVSATTARRQSAAVAFYRAEGYDPVGESAEAGYRLVRFEKEL
jgi:GNAT superfamily N-acetyltransferase